MISVDKYNTISSFLKKITSKVFEVENNNRKEMRETELCLYQEGFSIEECFTYKIGSIVFYFACNYSFLKIVERSILAARKKYPELFGTGDAQSIIEALYKESGHQNSIDEYCEYLQNTAGGRENSKMEIDKRQLTIYFRAVLCAGFLVLFVMGFILKWTLLTKMMCLKSMIFSFILRKHF